MKNEDILKKITPVQNFSEIEKSLYDFPKRRVAVACGHDYAAIEALARADNQDMADGIFVGNREKIERKAKEKKIDISKTEIVHVEDDVEATREAVKLVSRGDCDVLMKGKVHTDDFLRAILDKEIGLPRKHYLSHVFLIRPEKLGRFICVTDAAMNISPNFEQKADIASNAIGLSHALGVEKPKVAVLAAVELVNPSMQATQDAAILSLMSLRGQFDRAVVDGPFAFDNAVSPLAAEIKGIQGEVAGKADILLVPTVESGNILIKTFSYWAEGEMGGVLLGAEKPIILTSRADSPQSKYNSVCLAIYLENMRRARVKLGKVR